MGMSHIGAKPTYLSDRKQVQVTNPSWRKSPIPWTPGVVGCGVEAIKDGNNKDFLFRSDTSSAGRTYWYDPLLDTWTQKADIPTLSSGYAYTVAPNGKLYAFVGIYTYEYTPSTNTWAAKAAPPTSRSSGQAVTGLSNGLLYYMGGYVGFTSGTASNSGSAKNEAYDPTNNTWTSKVDIPSVSVTGYGRRSNTLVAGAGTNTAYIWSFGGMGSTYNGTSESTFYDKNVYRYDIAGNTWLTKAVMPATGASGAYPSAMTGYYNTPGTNGAYNPLDNKIYIFGGFAQGSGNTGVVAKYDPALDTYTYMQAVTATNGYEVVVYNNLIYGWVSSSTGFSYNPADDNGFGIANTKFKIVDTYPDPALFQVLSNPINNTFYVTNPQYPNGFQTTLTADITNTAARSLLLQAPFTIEMEKYPYSVPFTYNGGNYISTGYGILTPTLLAMIY